MRDRQASPLCPAGLLAVVTILLFHAGAVIPPANAESRAMPPNVKLEPRFEVSADELSVDFTVINLSDAHVYVFDRTFEVDAAGQPVLADLLEIAMPERGAAIVSSKLAPVPPGMTFAAPLTLYGSPVAPGERHRNVLKAPLPLRPTGWRTPRDSKGQILTDRIVHDTCSRVRFELGILPPGAAGPAPEVHVAGVPVARFGADAIGQQVVLIAEADRLALPCWTGTR